MTQENVLRIPRRGLLKTGVAAAGLVAGGLIGVVGAPAVEAGGVGSPTTFYVLAGAGSRDGAIQMNVFLPNEIFVNVGDTVTWKFTAMESHTVTFPVPFNDPNAWLTPFDPGSGGPDFDGSATANSGLLGMGASYSLTFTATGDFDYVCVLHGNPFNDVQRGKVHVLPAGSARPFTQGDYNRMAIQQRAPFNRQAQVLLQQNLRLAHMRDSNGHRIVVVGNDNGNIDLMRFYPQNITIRLGETLHFWNPGSDAPHTVTFGAEPGGGALPALFHPSHGPGGDPADYQGGDLHSGFLWAQNPPGFGGPFPTTFHVTFTKVGRFPYICALHDEMGMRGSVTVTR